MPQSPWLTLIVPGSAASLAESAESEHPPGAAQLARIAGRGSVQYRWDRRDRGTASLRPWQRGLLVALGLPASPYPSAAVSMFAGSAIATDCWMHATLAHFAAGLDRLTFVPLSGAASVSDEERAAIQPIIAAHLRSCAMELHSLPDGEWLIRCEGSLAVQTAAPDTAAAIELERAMPNGADAGALRRLMTELQMLLHDHPVNETRAQCGLPAINAVWPWGTGQLQSTQMQTLPAAFSEEPYVRGIYRLHQQTVQAAPRDVHELLHAMDRSARSIAVVTVADIASLEECWIAPLTHALASGNIRHLDLVLDGWSVEINRSALRRFWRRALPPAEWVA